MELIQVHPIFDRFCDYNDHYDGELPSLGDALGRDCIVSAFLPENMDFARHYRGDGSKNEDWFSFNARVYAPVSGTICDIRLNPVTNEPGHMNPSPASWIIIDAGDGLKVMLAHIQSPAVAVGDQVTEGQYIAHVGNNGYARHPHIHIGAYRNETPVAISFDPKKVAEVVKRVGECYWVFGISEEEFKEKYGELE